MNNNYTIRLGDPKDAFAPITVTIDPVAEYIIFGKPMLGRDVLKMDWSYLSWLSALCLEPIIKLGTVGYIFHPEVEEENKQLGLDSKYANKDNESCERIWKREQSKNQVDMMEQRKLIAEVDITDDAMRNKKTKVVSRLTNQGYKRELALSKTNEYLSMFGVEYLNFSVAVLASKIDDWVLTGNAPKRLKSK